MKLLDRIAKLSTLSKVIITIAVIIIFCSLYQCKWCQTLHMEGFEGDAPASKPEFVLFYVDWCPHCKSVLPIFKQLESDKMEIKILNAEDPNNAELVQKYNVEAYPTILTIKNGKATEYNEERSKEAFEAYMKSQ